MFWWRPKTLVLHISPFVTIVQEPMWMFLPRTERAANKRAEWGRTDLVISVQSSYFVVFLNTWKEKDLRTSRIAVRNWKVSLKTPKHYPNTFTPQNTCCLWLCTAGFSKVLSCRHLISADFLTTAPLVSLNITSLKLPMQKTSSSILSKAMKSPVPLCLLAAVWQCLVALIQNE